jgi:hypothetical protein
VRTKRMLIGKCGYECSQCQIDLEGEEFSRINGERVCTECEETERGYASVDTRIRQDLAAAS